MKLAEKIIGLWLLLVLLFGLEACTFSSGLRIDPKKVRQIQKMQTSKKEIFAWFAQPTAIARFGEIVTLPSIPVWGKRLQRGELHYEIQSETWYALFQVRTDAPIGDFRRIYYYRYTLDKHSMVPLPFYFREYGDTRVEELWLLVNEKNGIVEDYFFRVSPNK